VKHTVADSTFQAFVAYRVPGESCAAEFATQSSIKTLIFKNKMQKVINVAVIATCLLAGSEATLRKQQKIIDPQKCTSIGVGRKAMIDGST
jgi:hypothetical protein